MPLSYGTGSGPKTMLAGCLHVPASNDAVGHAATPLMQREAALHAGLKAGPGTAARLEAGNREEGFACFFQVCAVLSHQICTDGSVFFHRQLSKAGLVRPYTKF